MRIGFYSVGFDTPAARYRVRQFFPHFEANGIICELHYAYGRGYNRLLHTKLAAPYKLLTRTTRALHTLDVKRYDMAFLQRTAFPWTALPERLASLRNPKIIFDFDDAIYLGNSGAPSTSCRRAFKHAVELASVVLAGTQYLAEQTGHPEKTVVVPTVIDTDLYTPRPTARTHGSVVIGWMGTASNFDSLRSVLPAVRTVLSRQPKATFRIISNGRLPELERVPQIEMRDWSAESEIADLRDFDVGIMPLEDNAVSRGKCGFKLILYMAMGLPVVASPIGANLEIVNSAVGFLPAYESEWVECLEALLEQPERRAELGPMARERAVAHYSVQSVLPLYLEQFARLHAAS